MSDELSYPTTTNDTLSEHIDNLGISILNEWKEKCFRRLKNIPYIDNEKLNIDHQLTTEGFEAFVEARQSLLKS